MTSPKVAFISGSTAGIGKAIAQLLAANQFDVLINGRREDNQVRDFLQELDSLNGRPNSCHYLKGSISEETVRQSIFDFIQKQYGRLHLLINNAGITTEGRKDMLELTEDNMQKVFQVNLFGPFLLTSLLSSFLIQPSCETFIINISSISAYTASVNRADYCMSKAAMSMMTQLFAQRLINDNVRVFEIRPGIIHTDMTSGIQEKYDKLIQDGLLPIKRWGEPLDIAKMVLAIANGAFSYSTGEIINVDGGFHLRRL